MLRIIWSTFGRIYMCITEYKMKLPMISDFPCTGSNIWLVVSSFHWVIWLAVNDELNKMWKEEVMEQCQVMLG